MHGLLAQAQLECPFLLHLMFQSGCLVHAGESHLAEGSCVSLSPEIFIVKGNLGIGCFRQVLSNLLNTTVCFLGYRFCCSLCGNKVV